MSASTDRAAPLGPGPSVPGVTRQLITRLWTRTRTDGSRHQARHVWSDHQSAGYFHMMSSKIIPVIQSFQSKLRLFESLKTQRDRELSRSCNLVTGSFSSRRIHLVSRSFLRYLAGALWVRVLSARGQCVTNVTPVITETPERERAGNGECQWDNCVTTQGSARPSDS